MNEKRRVRPVPKWLERIRNNRARAEFQVFIESVFRSCEKGITSLESEAREQGEEWAAEDKQQECEMRDRLGLPHPPSIQ